MKFRDSRRNTAVRPFKTRDALDITSAILAALRVCLCIDSYQGPGYGRLVSSACLVNSDESVPEIYRDAILVCRLNLARLVNLNRYLNHIVLWRRRTY